MKYETPSHAAKRLGVTPRAIQKWASEGRIPGACKMGGSWMIPTSFTEPLAKGTVKEVQKADSVRSFVSVLNLSVRPGEYLSYIESVKEEDDRALLYAEYCFHCGRVEEALKIAEPYTHSSDVVHRHMAGLICSFANLSMGRRQFAMLAIQKMKESFSDPSSSSLLPQNRAMRVWLVHTFSVLLRISDVGAEPLEEWLRYLPGGYKLFACYEIAHRMFLQNKLQGAHAVSRIAVDLSSEHFPLAELYCRLMDAIILINSKRVKDAERSFLIAWELALADGFFEPIAEHYFMLQGLVERCISKDYPEEFRKITDTSLVFAKNGKYLAT